MIFYGAPIHQISFGSEKKNFSIWLSLDADNSADKRQILLRLTYFLLLIFCSTSVQILNQICPKPRFGWDKKSHLSPSEVMWDVMNSIIVVEDDETIFINL